jgi:hypothetical protein
MFRRNSAASVATRRSLRKPLRLLLTEYILGNQISVLGRQSLLWEFSLCVSWLALFFSICERTHSFREYRSENTPNKNAAIAVAQLIQSAGLLRKRGSKGADLEVQFFALKILVPGWFDHVVLNFYEMLFVTFSGANRKASRPQSVNLGS